MPKEFGHHPRSRKLSTYFSVSRSPCSDVSKVVLCFHDGQQRILRRAGERYQPSTMIAHNRCGGGSVMIWGGIAATWRTKTHMCQGNATGLFYRDNAIEPIVVPYACRHGNAFIFQDNNAKPHRARVVQDHLQFRRITTLS